MRWLILLAVACSSTHHASIDAPVDGPGDPVACKAELEAQLDRQCGSDADCVLVESEDCCGPIMLGIHAGTEGAFPPKEQAFEACLACPPLGCAHAPEDEMGHPSFGSDTSIAAICSTGRCTSMVQ
jgi:hypothetical protein